ncbi:MAG: hypothetical protein QXR69_03435 [Conexivisphaerales archaeon]
MFFRESLLNSSIVAPEKTSSCDKAISRFTGLKNDKCPKIVLNRYPITEKINKPVKPHINTPLPYIWKFSSHHAPARLRRNISRKETLRSILTLFENLSLVNVEVKIEKGVNSTPQLRILIKSKITEKMVRASINIAMLLRLRKIDGSTIAYIIYIPSLI